MTLTAQLWFGVWILILKFDASECAHGYYSLDYWLQTQSDYLGLKDPMFLQNVASFVPFSEMEDKRFRDCELGFPNGASGSSLIPTTFHFVYMPVLSITERVSDKEFPFMQIPTRSQYVPIFMKWDLLLDVCNDTAVPMCSWDQFLSFADPFMIDQNALKRLNPYLNRHMICNEDSWGIPKTYQFGCRDAQSHFKSPSYEETLFLLAHAPFTLGSCYPIRSKAHMSLIYIFTVCSRYVEHIRSNNFLQKICPDPCKAHPCAKVNFALNCRATGIRKDSFVCLCLEKYEWDPVAQRCVLKNFCMYENTEEARCDKDGTLRCHFDETNGAKCVCREEYMGEDCSLKRDACYFDEEGRSGNDACNVALGFNKCRPIPGKNTYVCECGQLFTANPNLPYDNCDKKVPPCASTLCIMGSCRVTDDGMHGACVCDPDYKGPACDIPRGSWTKWQAWTACAPSCSDNPMRRRVRDCVGESDDCVGPVEEVEMCAPSECAYGVSPEQLELQKLGEIVRSMAILAGVGLFLALAVLVSLSGLHYRKQKQPVAMEVPQAMVQSPQMAEELGWGWGMQEDEST